MDNFKAIQTIFEQGQNVKFTVDHQQLEIENENAQQDKFNIHTSSLEYQLLVQKIATIYNQVNLDAYQDLFTIIDRLNFEENIKQYQQPVVIVISNMNKTKAIQKKQNKNNKKKNNKKTKKDLEDEEIQKELEEEKVREIFCQINSDKTCRYERPIQNKKDQFNKFFEEKAKFNEFQDSEYFENRFFNYNLNPILESKLENENYISFEFCKTTQNKFKTTLDKLNKLVINLLVKTNSFSLSIDFQYLRDCLAKNILSFERIKFIESQRLSHLNDRNQQFINTTNNYHCLINFLNQKNLQINVEQLDISIEQLNLISHDNYLDIDLCNTCEEILIQDNKKNFFKQKYIDLKNIKAHQININLMQNFPALLDLEINHIVRKVKFIGQIGTGVNFIFQNNSHINEVEWAVQEFSLQQILTIFEKFYQGKIGHLSFTNLSQEFFFKNFIHPNILSSQITYSFLSPSINIKQKSKKDTISNSFKELQLLVNSKFIILLQGISLYKLTNQFNFSQMRIFQDLYF
ncbi:hypothetical protein ABPG74_018341 [Tetrahymena malaccensis]